MSRLPLDYIDVELGEDSTYTTPAPADKWAAAMRTDLMPPMSLDYAGNPGITHGGPPPEWLIVGRFDIARGTYIPSPKAPPPGLRPTPAQRASPSPGSRCASSRAASSARR